VELFHSLGTRLTLSGPLIYCADKAMPTIVVSKELAIQKLTELIEAGEKLLSSDPAKAVDGTFLSKEEIGPNLQALRRQTADWVKTVRATLSMIYSYLPLMSLQASSEGLYPKVEPLRALLRDLTKSESPQSAKKDPSPKDLLKEGISPNIAKRCNQLYRLKHYDEAVFNAFKCVEEDIRNRAGAAPEDVGVALVSKAMNPKAPILVFSGVTAEQEAFHSLFRGAIGAFKNPHSHRFIELADSNDALRLLQFASLLMSLLARSNISP
jgi:uncharacterized protein (TIGR02391 family)